MKDSTQHNQNIKTLHSALSSTLSLWVFCNQTNIKGNNQKPIIDGNNYLINHKRELRFAAQDSDKA